MSLLLLLRTAAVAPTPLSGALAETDTVGAALSVTSTPLTATLALVPSSGVIPFTVTATCTATGGGATKSYAWTWGDGATTPASASASATHLVTSSGLYTVTCTVGQSTTVGLAGAMIESDTLAAALVSLAAGGITHGQQMNASNTGIAYAGLTVGQLTTAGSTTYSTAGQVITNMYFTGPVVLNAANITLRNCQVEASGSSTKAVEVTASGVLIENCTIIAPGATSGYMGIHMGGTNLTVRRCDISKFENNMTIEGGPTLVEYSYLHDSSNVSNPTGHRDCCEIYAGDDVTLRMNRMVHPAGETSVINIAPWYGATNVLRCTVQDCFLDGGNMITLVDLQSTGVINFPRFLRNKLGGHTDPAVLGRYAALNNADNRAIVGTAAAQTSDPNAILWPTTGADVSYWDECADLTPNRTGQIVLP